MNERTLGKVLLVKAVEEADGAGELLPLADREQATREVVRAAGGASGGPAPDARAARVLGLLASRADRLAPALARRYPVCDAILERSRVPAWATWLVLSVALACGVLLASLDGTRRINILAFPFFGVIAWNLAVYASIALLAARRLGGSARTRAPPRWTSRAIARRLGGLVERTSQVHARLGEVVSRYAADWARIGAPLLASHARRLLHLGAAAIAVGLALGLYLRGVVFRYEAGWESTFLGPRAVRAILDLVFGPAASLTGIALPATDAATAALRWTGNGGGGDAAPWIHLVAATLVLYVVAPRLVLALLASLDAWRWRRAAALPEELDRYARATLGAAQVGHGDGRVVVVPYAHGVDAAPAAALGRWITEEYGRGARAELRPMVGYGAEEEVTASLADPSAPGGLVLLVSLAATPEAENHGLAIARLREAGRAARPPCELRVVVDEAPYSSRLGGDASLAGRLEERRSLWREFVRGYGLEASLVDLGR